MICPNCKDTGIGGLEGITHYYCPCPKGQSEARWLLPENFVEECPRCTDGLIRGPFTRNILGYCDCKKGKIHEQWAK